MLHVSICMEIGILWALQVKFLNIERFSFLKFIVLGLDGLLFFFFFIVNVINKSGNLKMRPL